MVKVINASYWLGKEFRMESLVADDITEQLSEKLVTFHRSYLAFNRICWMMASRYEKITTDVFLTAGCLDQCMPTTLQAQTSLLPIHLSGNFSSRRHEEPHGPRRPLAGYRACLR